MTRIKKASVGVLVAVFFVGAIFLANRFVTTEETPAQAAPSNRAELGVIRFPAGAPQLAAIQVKAVEEFPVPRAEPLNGRIAFDENATARVSSPILGRAVKINFSPGDSVRGGDTLLVMDSPDLAQAVSDLSKARADEQRKKQAFDRAKTLLEGGVVPRKDYEAAEAEHVQTRAETRRAELRLRNLNPAAGAEEARDGRYAVRAPLAGVVADRQVNPGMEVRPDLQNPLFVITDPARLWVIIDLPERDLSKVEIGRIALVQVDAYPEEQFRAVIQRVGQVVDPGTRRVQVRCNLTSPDRKLKPEMFARVTLVDDESKRAIRVPNSALITEGLYSYVFVEKEPGTFEKRRLQLGVQQDPHFSYVQSGLNRGERIVVVGPLLLNAEMKSAQ